MSGRRHKNGLARGSDLSITSMRDEIGLCPQTGNMAQMDADLIKLQTLQLTRARCAPASTNRTQAPKAAVCARRRVG